MIPFFLLFLAVFNAHSFDPAEGNGGNICIQAKKWRNWGTVYRTLDELTNPDMAPPSRRVFSEPLVTVKKENSLLSSTDLTTTKAGKLAWLRLTWFEFRHPELAHELKNYFLLFNRVFVSEKSFRPVGIDYKTVLKCKEGTAEAAIRTDIYGSTVISAQAWNKLELSSQVILLLHETIRLSQMYSAWGQRLTNRDLQSFTMYLFDLREDLLYYSSHEDRFIYQLYRFKDFKIADLEASIEQLNYSSEELIESHRFAEVIRTSHELALREWMMGIRLRSWEESKHFRFTDRVLRLREDKRYNEFLESYLPMDMEEF